MVLVCGLLGVATWDLWTPALGQPYRLAASSFMTAVVATHPALMGLLRHIEYSIDRGEQNKCWESHLWAPIIWVIWAAVALLILRWSPDALAQLIAQLVHLRLGWSLSHVTNTVLYPPLR